MTSIKFSFNALAEILEKFDTSYFCSFTLIYACLYLTPDFINQKLFMNKYMGILSFIMIFSLVVIFSRVIRKMGVWLSRIYENHKIVNEIKEMSHNYYPLENKILELLAKENLRKFEIDILDREFFQQDNEQLQSNIEDVEFDNENILTSSGKKLFDLYQSDNAIFNECVARALQNIVARKIIILENNTYTFSYGAWHYYKSWINTIINFIKNSSNTLYRKIKRKYRGITKQLKR